MRDDVLNILVVVERLDILRSISALDEKMKAEMLFLKKVWICAFVTDKKWLQYLVNMQNVLLPTMEVKVFDKDQQDLARQWLTQSDGLG